MIRRFNRFELKYIIDGAKRDAISRDLAEQMLPDPHGGRDGSYRVTSLYYDSPGVSCFWSKVEGIKYRRKVRIRTYGAYAGEDDRVMVEIKQRINRTVQKRRLVTPLDTAYALCEGNGAALFQDPEDSAVAAEVTLLARWLQLGPACVISYLRQAWVGSRYEPGLRLTFDQDLSCRGPEHGLGRGSTARSFLPPDRLIMEVKANDTVPLWVTHLLGRHGCSLHRVSKYCLGLVRLHGTDRPLDLLRGNEWTSC